MQYSSIRYFFFFQAEDGIRDTSVTGVQTCALPISEALEGRPGCPLELAGPSTGATDMIGFETPKLLFEPDISPAITRVSGCKCRASKIGRASCRERVWTVRLGGAEKHSMRD